MIEPKDEMFEMNVTASIGAMHMENNFDELIEDVMWSGRVGSDESCANARKALTDAISAVTSERDNLASRVRELARIISDDGTPDEDLYQSLTEGLPEVAK